MVSTCSKRSSAQARQVAESCPPESRTSADRASASTPVIFGPTIRGLVNPQGSQMLKLRLQALPNPLRDVFCCWILETRNIVQTLVVERMHDVGKRRFHIEEVRDKSRDGIDRPVKLYLDAVGVAVKPAATVARRHVRKPVGRLKPEGLGYLHRMPRCLWVCTLKRHLGWARQ